MFFIEIMILPLFSVTLLVLYYLLLIEFEHVGEQALRLSVVGLSSGKLSQPANYANSTISVAPTVIGAKI